MKPRRFSPFFLACVVFFGISTTSAQQPAAVSQDDLERRIDDKIERKIERIKGRLSEVEEELAGLKREVQQTAQTSQNTARRLEDVCRDVQVLKDASRDLAYQLTRLETYLTTHSQALQTITAQIENLQLNSATAPTGRPRASDKLELEVFSLKNELQNMASEFEQFKRDAETRDQAIENQLSEIVRQLNDLKATLAKQATVPQLAPTPVESPNAVVPAPVPSVRKPQSPKTKSPKSRNAP